MGGGGGIGGVVKGIGTGLGAIATGGTSLIPGSPTKRIGQGIGSALTLNPSGVKSAMGMGGDIHAPTVGGQQDPMSMLTMSGGAPLLTNIALGADVGTTLMGYFGASGDYKNWLGGLAPEDQQAVSGLHDQLTQIQTNTDLRNHAVQKLTDDFPNIMAASIPKYSAMADSATSDMMNKAMAQISAKQAAGGNFSSGATAAAAARAGADIGMQKLQYGTGMALQDFSQQYNQATGLQAFQQKMLGQGASQGFNAVQNALQRNAGLAGQQADLSFKADQSNQNSSNAMFGALGGLAGTLGGGYMQGLGMAANRLNTNTSAPSGNNAGSNNGVA